MKKIKLLTFLSILLCSFFIINFNYKASANDNFRKFTSSDVTFTLVDTGTTTSLYEVIVTINTTYELENNVILYFKQEIPYNLRTPLNRGYNSYNIITLNKVDTNKWELQYRIALLNTFLQNYNYEINYVLTELIDVFIETKSLIDNGDIPSDKYIYQVIDFVYDDNFTVTNYSVGTTDFTFKFIIIDELLEDNTYLQSPSDFQNNIYFQFYNFTGGLRNSYTTILEQPELSGGYLTTIVTIPKDRFYYYYSEILGIDETTFFNNFMDYLEDISNYFKLYVRTDFVTDYNSVYNAGFNEGNEQGYINGYNQGRSEGYVEGYNNGYEIGLQISQGEAYDQGYIDGYNDGSSESFIANLDKWIVPAIIIVMITGGFFVITRKKRDGDI